MTEHARAMPDVLRAVNALDYDYRDGEGIDFEPYTEFMSAAETTHWIRAWTGNTDAVGDAFLMFGQDGTGGLAAIWLVDSAAGLLNQPIVFLGSEGEIGVVARNFQDYLWLLAGGFGPYEAIAYPGTERQAQPQFVALATHYAGGNLRKPAEIIADARAAYPDFEEYVSSLCRYR